MRYIRRRHIYFLISFLATLLVAFNYNYLDSAITGFLIDRDTAKVERIIDGDTIVVDSGDKIRLLGINTPEKGEEYYADAKEFLEGLILNKTVEVEYGKSKKDRYGRTLGYIFLNGKNINQKLIEEGFANAYFPSGKDFYYDNFNEAWKECIKNNIKLCKSSEDICRECIILKEFDYEGEIMVLRNSCNIDCNLTGWNIKDEGIKKFIFNNFILKPEREVDIIVGNGTNTSERIYWTGEEYVWTSTGDTMFLRDSKGGLVLWENY